MIFKYDEVIDISALSSSDFFARWKRLHDVSF